MAAIHAEKKKKSTKIVIEVINSHRGTPEGIRINMAIGEVSGIIDNHQASGPLGSSAIGIMSTIVNNRGMVIGIINCCESVSLSTADPTAAKREAYSK